MKSVLCDFYTLKMHLCIVARASMLFSFPIRDDRFPGFVESYNSQRLRVLWVSNAESECYDKWVFSPTSTINRKFM